jgi:hypothetical protein
VAQSHGDDRDASAGEAHVLLARAFRDRELQGHRHAADVPQNALGSKVVDICATPSGSGYWLVTGAGGVFAFGDAHTHGAKVATHAPVVSIARTSTGNGYWPAASDGTIGAFGDAPVLGTGKVPTAVLVRC